MEVKIKQGSEMLDATIKIVDGVMVVLPNEVKWKPKEGEIFHSPIFNNELGEFVTDYQKNDGTIFMSIYRDWCFKTGQECQEFCNRLNDAINSVKP